MYVYRLQAYPVKENMTGAQTIEMISERVMTLGGVQTGQFLVDCDTYASTMHLGMYSDFFLTWLLEITFY